MLISELLLSEIFDLTKDVLHCKNLSISHASYVNVARISLQDMVMISVTIMLEPSVPVRFSQPLLAFLLFLLRLVGALFSLDHAIGTSIH